SALFVLRRIRNGLGTGQDAPKLTGTVEADEVYIGGRPRYRGTKTGRPGPESNKTPVMGMVQRNGDVRFRMLERLTADRMHEVIAENADLTCRLITDDFPKYRPIGRAFQGGHEVVRHREREYVRVGTD